LDGRRNSRCTRFAAWPRPLATGRRRDRLPGLVPERRHHRLERGPERREQDHHDIDERRGRARVLHVPPAADGGPPVERRLARPTTRRQAARSGRGRPPCVNHTPPMTTGIFTGLDTIGEPAVSGYDPMKDGYRQTPAFVWSGNTGLYGPEQLYRVYVFSDQD